MPSARPGAARSWPRRSPVSSACARPSTNSCATHSAVNAARSLHELADLVRFRYGVTPHLNPDEARNLIERCQALWERRNALAVPSGPGSDSSSDAERTIKADLIELAAVWSDLRVRLAPPEERVSVQRAALDVLETADAAYGPGLALRQQRRVLAEALGEPRDKLEPDPTPRTAWDHDDLGRVLLRSGRVAAASAEFRRALAIRPQDFWPNFYEGTCAYRLGRFEDALGAFRACITLSPGTAACYYNRALACAALGRDEEATADYTRALELDPRLPAAALNRGILAFKAGRYREAIDDFDRARRAASRSDPEFNAQVEYNLALAQLARNDRPAASVSLDRAIALGSREARTLRERLTVQP